MMSCDGIVNVPISVQPVRHVQPKSVPSKRRKRTRAMSEIVVTLMELDNLSNVPLETASSEVDSLFDVPVATTSCGLHNFIDVPLATASTELHNLIEVPLATASNELNNLFEVPPIATASNELDNLLDVPIEVNATLVRNRSGQQENGNAARHRKFRASRTTQQRIRVPAINTAQQRKCSRSRAKSTTGMLLALIEEKRREYAGLEEKLKNSSLGKDVLEGELNGLRTECSELKQRVAQLEEGNRVLCEKEKNGQEEILSLLSVKDKCDQLERKNESLELEKNRLERELNDTMISLKDLTDQNSHLEHQALVCESEKVALNSRITDLCEEIRNLKEENQGLNRADSAEMNCLDKDASDNGEERSNTNKNEEIQSESGNRIDAVISEPRNRNEETEHEASVDLDCDALPTGKGRKNNPIDVESYGEKNNPIDFESDDTEDG